MANELQISYTTAKTVYALIRNSAGQIWNGSAFESYTTLNYTNYDIAATEQGTASAFYVASFPTLITTPGNYSIVFKSQTGGTPAETDPTIGAGNFEWNGSAAFNLGDLATSGQIAQVSPIKIYRGQMLLNFPFKLVSSADHVTPFVSGVVSGQISRDGGNFGALQSGNVSEIGLGWYKANLTSGDLAANTVALVFTANGISGGTSDQRDFSLILQRASGY